VLQIREAGFVLVELVELVIGLGFGFRVSCFHRVVVGATELKSFYENLVYRGN
jgi:hypothetical protein